MKENDLKNPLFNYAKYSSLAFQMLAVILLGVVGGIKLDQYLKLKFPIFTILFTLVGVAFAVYLGIKDFIKLHPKNSKNNQSHDE